AASIRSGQSFFKILGLPEEEFPPLPKFEEAKVVTIRQKDLRDGLRKTSYAISTDETRYVLNGLLFSFKDNKLTLVATDGRRLAMVDIELEFPRSHEADIIVPTKAVTELGRLLTDDGEVKVSVGSGQIAFELNNTLLVSKLIEGNYPNYKQVIPTETKERVTLERETFLNSLRRVSLLASDKSNSIKLNFSKNNIDITANTPEVGEAKESLPVAYKGRDFSIAFNPEFCIARPQPRRYGRFHCHVRRTASLRAARQPAAAGGFRRTEPVFLSRLPSIFRCGRRPLRRRRPTTDGLSRAECRRA